MEHATRLIAVIVLLVVGLSHIIRPRAWARFFAVLAAQGEAGVFANAILHLLPGVIIVAFHNVWRGIPAILTVIGWGYVAKSTVYFVAPGLGLRVLRSIDENHARRFVAAGVVMVVVGLVLLMTLLPSSGR